MPGHPCPPCCPGGSPCQCPLCYDGPDSVCVFKVVIDGMEWEAAGGFHADDPGNPFGYCEQCECMDGTYYFTTINGCSWTLGFIDGEFRGLAAPVMPFQPCRRGSPLRGVLYLYDDEGTIKLRFVIGFGAPLTPTWGGLYVWEQEYGASGPDCKSLVDEDLPFIEDNAEECDATSATVKVTTFSTTPIGRPSSSNTLGDCLSCKCNRESEIPDQFEVTIAGVDNGDPTCEGCSGIDGTYTLTKFPWDDMEWDETRRCFWTYTLPAPVQVCNDGYVHAIHIETRFAIGFRGEPEYFEATDRYELLVIVNLENIDRTWAAPMLTWIYTPGVGPENPYYPPQTHPYPIDCANLSAQALTPPGSPSWCDGSGSTCTVTTA